MAASADGRVALLGAGIMGAAMARNLLAAGLPVTVWDRSAEVAGALASAGAQAADSPPDAVRDAQVVITMLPDAAVVDEVIFDGGAAAALAPHAVWAQMGTIGTQGTVRAADRLRQLRPDVYYVDAPVSGSKGPAESGTLLILASGPAEAAPVVPPGVRGDRPQDGVARRGGPGQQDEARRQRLHVRPDRGRGRGAGAGRPAGH